MISCKISRWNSNATSAKWVLEIFSGEHCFQQSCVIRNYFTGKTRCSTFALPDTSTISPGTRYFALIFWIPGLSWRMTFAISGSYSFNASIADSAFLSCHTPIMAFNIKISKMTKGSTKAVIWSSESSKKANTWNTKQTRMTAFINLFSGRY